MALPGMSSSFGTRNINLDGRGLDAGHTLSFGRCTPVPASGTSRMVRWSCGLLATPSSVSTQTPPPVRWSTMKSTRTCGSSRTPTFTLTARACCGLTAISRRPMASIPSRSWALARCNLTGNNAYTAGTTVTAGTLFASGANALGTGNVINNGTLGFAGFVDYTVGNSISGTGGRCDQGWRLDTGCHTLRYQHLHRQHGRAAWDVEAWCRLCHRHPRGSSTSKWQAHLTTMASIPALSPH